MSKEQIKEDHGSGQTMIGVFLRGRKCSITEPVKAWERFKPKNRDKY